MTHSNERAASMAPSILRPSPNDFAPIVERFIRDEASGCPEVALARLKRALRETVLASLHELEWIKGYLEGESLEQDVPLRKDLPGVTPAFWLARDLFVLEEVLREAAESGERGEREDFSSMAGRTAKDLIEEAIARPDENRECGPGGTLGSKALTLRLTAILLGADAAEDMPIDRCAPEDSALERSSYPFERHPRRGEDLTKTATIE